MNGRQQLATINGGGNPRWNSFVTAGASVFPTFFEEPLSPIAVNKYKGVVFKFTDGEEYTFPAYHAEVPRGTCEWQMHLLSMLGPPTPINLRACNARLQLGREEVTVYQLRAAWLPKTVSRTRSGPRWSPP